MRKRLMMIPRKATFRQKENPVVLFLYQQCEEVGTLHPATGHLLRSLINPAATASVVPES